MRRVVRHRPPTSHSRAVLCVAAAFAMAIVITSCAPTPAAPSATAAPAGSAAATGAATPSPIPMSDVTFRLDFTLNGKHAPFFLGVDKGYFRDAGINLKILEGKGSLSTAQLVASKGDTFGFADATPVAATIAGGAKIRMVANFQQKSPNAALSFSPLASPKDFPGKTVGIASAGATGVAWAAFLAKNGLTESQMTMVTLDGTALLPALLQGRIQIDVGAANTEGAAAPVQSGKPVNILIFADWGVNALAHGLVAHQDTIDQNPDLVRRFVAAAVKSWQAGLDDPTAAVDSIMKAHPELNKEIVANQLKLSLPLTHSSNTTGQPIGRMADADWVSTLDLLKASGTKTDLPPSAFYTNALLPQ